jgi:hypothetical protein
MSNARDRLERNIGDAESNLFRMTGGSQFKPKKLADDAHPAEVAAAQQLSDAEWSREFDWSYSKPKGQRSDRRDWNSIFSTFDKQGYRENGRK